MEIAESVLELIGNTPLVRLRRVAATVRATVAAKLEFMNPGGSVKDRVGRTIVEAAEREGQLRPGGVIVEATSGNTGVGLAMAAAVKGYHTVFVMPDKMSAEKVALLQAYGARVVITPTNVEPEDPRSYYSVSRRLASTIPGAFYANQYHNPVNPQAHYETTGPEIWRQTGGRIDVLVAGMGTGGTISGAARYLKERKPDLKVVGVDPEGSVYTEYFRTGRLGEAHTYKIEGIGEDFLPSTMDFSVVDEVVQVSDREAFHMTRRLVREEGLFAGGSSGAAVAGAVKYLEGLPGHGEGLVVVVILPDGGSRYLSKVFNDQWMREHGLLQPPAGRIADVLAAAGNRTVITAGLDETISELIARMRTHGISQLPVVERGELVGMVDETTLLERLASGDIRPTDRAARVTEVSPPVVHPDDPVEAGLAALAHATAAVVVDRGAVLGIISKIDLIEWLAQHRS
ncbi:MAG: cystathionine beta-synthase [Bacillota bacterium]